MLADIYPEAVQDNGYTRLLAAMPEAPPPWGTVHSAYLANAEGIPYPVDGDRRIILENTIKNPSLADYVV